VLARKSKNRRIQSIIVSPFLVIFGGSEKFILRGTSRDVVVHLGLETLLKTFHPNRQVRVELLDLPDDRELVQMVIVTVMGLANKDDAFARYLSGKFVRRESRIQIRRIEGSLILRRCPDNPEDACERENARYK
jgi:hypothetical protein